MENKKQNRDWMVTLPAREYAQEYVEKSLSRYCYVGQLERASSGYDHWQIFIANRSPIKFETLQSKFPKGHFETRRESKEACVAYVTKKDTGLGILIQNGEIAVSKKTPGRGESVKILRKAILEENKTATQVLLEYPEAAYHTRYLRDLEQAHMATKWSSRTREVQVRIIFGQPGVGKTRLAFETYGFSDTYSVSTYSHPFDAYDGQSTLLLDEFTGQLEIEFMLKLLDRYPLLLPARYNDKWAAFHNVVIISNSPPRSFYPRALPIHSQALRRRVGLVEQMSADGSLMAADW